MDSDQMVRDALCESLKRASLFAAKHRFLDYAGMIADIIEIIEIETPDIATATTAE